MNNEYNVSNRVWHKWTPMQKQLFHATCKKLMNLGAQNTAHPQDRNMTEERWKFIAVNAATQAAEELRSTEAYKTLASAFS